MTREEAIKVLKKYQPYMPKRADVEYYAIALNMAIEALSAQEGGDAEMNETKPKYMQPSPDRGDLISRADAIDAVSYETMECYQARKDIRALPSAEAVQVVRCGQCEHWKCNPNTNEYGVCNKVSCDEFEIVMHSDDFCSYGECKGGEDE